MKQTYFASEVLIFKWHKPKNVIGNLPICPFFTIIHTTNRILQCWVERRDAMCHFSSFSRDAAKAVAAVPSCALSSTLDENVLKGIRFLPPAPSTNIKLSLFGSNFTSTPTRFVPQKMYLQMGFFSIWQTRGPLRPTMGYFGLTQPQFFYNSGKILYNSVSFSGKIFIFS